MRRVQLRGGARGPHARRTPCTFRSEGGFAPLPIPPPRNRCAGKAGARKWNTPTCQAKTLMRDRSDALPPSDWWSASSAGFARAPNWGRLRRGPSRPPPIKRRRWALIIALVLDECGEVTAAQGVPELAERLDFDLTDPFPRHGKAPADLLERVFATVPQAEPEPEDFFLPGAQRPQRAFDLSRQVVAGQGVGRGFRQLVLDELA